MTRRDATLRLATVGLTLAIACLRPQPALRPDIILIVVDSLRADHLHHAGDSRELSPRLDALAAEGSRFSQARSAAPWTTPSVMTLFTGLLPTSHHLDHNDRSLDRSVPTLAERLKRAGYATCAVMPALTLSEHFGFDRGFDRFILEQQGHGRVSGPWTVERSLACARELKHRPLFLYAHFWDVHYNYNPPVPWSLRFQKGRAPGEGESDDVTSLVWSPDPLPDDRLAWLEGQYAGEIVFTDHQIGRLLIGLLGLGIGPDAIVVVTADHGEAFQEHHWLGHTNRVYDELHHVPWIVRWPGRVPAGRVIEEPVGLLDATPTLLGLAGVPFDVADFEGRSRAETLRGATPAPGSSGAPGPGAVEPEPLLLATTRQADLRALWTPQGSYVYDFVAGRGELYDHRADPGQQRDVAADRPVDAASWRRRLCKALARVPRRGEVPIVPLPPDIKAMFDAGLRSLGYVGDRAEREANLRLAARTQDAATERRRDLTELGCDASDELPPGGSAPR